LFTDGNSRKTFIEAVNSSWIAAAFYKYINSTGSYAVEDTLEAWGGYLVYAMRDNLKMLTPPNPGSGLDLAESKSGGAAVDSRGDYNGWELSVHAQQGNLWDELPTIGIHYNATDGYDPWHDFAVPPTSPSGNYVRLVFEHPEWNAPIGARFSSDIRGVSRSSSLVSWKLMVEASEPGPVTISFPDISEKLPAGYSAYAYHSGGAVDLTAQNSFTLDYTSPYSVKVVIRWDGISGSGEKMESGLPTEFAISEIYPNPFNPEANLTYTLLEARRVSLVVFDISGREVMRLVGGWQFAGQHSVVFDGSSFSSGVYFVRMTAGDFRQIRKMTLIK
jgi:hypothetical protein